MAESGARARLVSGAASLGVVLAQTQIEALEAYLGLLVKWNRVYNLTAVRDPGEMLTHHVLDSLAVVSPLRRHCDGRPVQLLDVGSGAGLPGIVVAICEPGISVTCIDAVEKKVAFIRQAISALRLPNARAVHGRVEEGSSKFDIICSRAFASLADFIQLTRGSLAEGGVWLAMKGRQPAQEINELPPDVEVFHVEPQQVPGLDADRCLVWMRPTKA